MPKINFEVRGKIRGADVQWALDKNGDAIDVSNISVFDLLEKLEKGELKLDPYTFLHGKNDGENIQAYLFERDRTEE